MKHIALPIIGIAGLLALVTAAIPALASGVSFDKNNFHHSTKITNQYFPLYPGTTFIYNGTKDSEPTHETFVVTHKTKKIAGLNAVVIRDTVSQSGKVVEIAFDWFAQDDAGNVWYMGEFTTDYGPNGQVLSHEGSWQAGVNGAKPGIVMEAHPKVGDTYQEEFAKDVAQDMAKILSLKQSVCVPYGCFDDKVLELKDSSPLEPGVVEHKYFAPGVGQLKTIMVKGGSEESHLVKIDKED